MSPSSLDTDRHALHPDGARGRNWRKHSATDVGALVSVVVTASEDLLAELRGLRADVRELMTVVRGLLSAPEHHSAHDQVEVPALMTIDEAGRLLRTSRRALYMRIRRGLMPGVVRVGPRRLMVKTDEFLSGLSRMPTLGESSIFPRRR